MNGLAGPLHGLANQEVLKWIQELKDKFEAEGKPVNAETITDNASFDDPRQFTTGIETVIVNGRVVVSETGPVESETPPGRSLRAGRSR